MRVIETRLEGLVALEPAVHGDERGFFVETYRAAWHEQLGLPREERFVQDNHSRSSRGVVRGLHFQVGAGVAKLVRCARGRILDVAVDLRAGSPTYGAWEGVELGEEDMRELFVPVGFAHGFCVLSETADVLYKQTAYYDAEVERGIAWDDPDVGIEWPLGAGELIVSERDAAAPRLADIAAELPFRWHPLTWMLSHLRERTNGYTVTARQYALLARVALGALTLIVLTGAAVRLTGSGLGCPTWPKCYGNYYPPLNTHSVIEFSNRVVSVPVVLAAGLAWLGALRRRPYRRDLVWNAALLPLGVICQAVLGGLTVKGELDYGWVMAHFALSMLILLAAVVLVWRSSHEFYEDEDGDADAADPGAGSAHVAQLPLDRGLLRGLIGLAALGALTIFAGTAATAAGPHAGGSPGQKINRLSFDGTGTMDFVIHRHGEIALAFGLASLAAWFLARRRQAPEEVRKPLTVLCWLLLLQGAVGLDQYKTHLPAGLVWVHVCLASLSWLATLWAACAAGAADGRLWARAGRGGAQAPVRGVAPLEFPGN